MTQKCRLFDVGIEFISSKYSKFSSYVPGILTPDEPRTSRCSDGAIVWQAVVHPNGAISASKHRLHSPTTGTECVLLTRPVSCPTSHVQNGQCSISYTGCRRGGGGQSRLDIYRGVGLKSVYQAQHICGVNYGWRHANPYFHMLHISSRK